MFSKIENAFVLHHADLNGVSSIILAQNYFKTLVSKINSYNAILQELQEIVAEVYNCASALTYKYLSKENVLSAYKRLCEIYETLEKRTQDV